MLHHLGGLCAFWGARGVTKAELQKVVRAVVDGELTPLGFRWRRMWKSSDGWYVRRWEGGVERVGIAIVVRHPHYKLQPFVTSMLDCVAEVVTPLLGYVDPEAMKDFSDHTFNLSPFVKGPPGDRYCEWEVQTEEEARRVLQEVAGVVRTAVEPWLLAHRTPAALLELVRTPWREAAPMHDPLRGMVEVTLAHLCASPEEARLASELLARTAGWVAPAREPVERLLTRLGLSR
jgi:hypothetical protein